MRSLLEIQVSPIALTWNDENYYMIGFYENTRIKKHFCVDKMIQIEIGEEERSTEVILKENDMVRYSTKLFSMFGRIKEVVTLEFDNCLIVVIIDRFGKNMETSQSFS